MAKAVFTHSPGSSYDDRLEERYHFPRTYLNVVRRAVGDWIVYYEPRRLEAGSERTGGRQAYFAVARVIGLDRDPARADHFYARMADYLPFPSPPSFREGGLYLESALRKEDGSTNRGQFGRNVRDLPDPEFDAILALGFAGVRPDLGAADWAAPDADGPPGGVAEERSVFEPAPRRIVEQIVSRPFREAVFARQVKQAYGETCAMTGLRILNGGGRPEVQAAHIRPVAEGGPDVVRNGLALCGTAHWMFDRGLVSVDDDLTLLAARERLPAAAGQLFNADGRLRGPVEPWMRPDRRFLDFHRRHVFKG
jgi:putative restriction endonuclease